MDENTVFTSSASQASDIPPQPPEIPINPEEQYQQSDDPSNRRFPSFSVGSIIKIFLGLFVVAIVLFLIFAIVIPLFSKKSTGKAEITYWGLWEDKNTIAPIIEDFNKKYPDIKVTYLKQDIKNYREKLSTRIANNTGPDVFVFHNSWYPMFSSNLLPLSTDIISKKEFADSFYPVAQKDLIKNGAIYAIPTELDTLALYANTDIFKSAGVKVPDNWEDFLKVASSLTVIDESGKIQTSGAALGTFDNIAHAPDIISMIFSQNGANINNLSSTQKAASEALTFYTSFATGDRRVWDNTLDNSRQAFKEGKVAMYFGYSWDYFEIKANNPNLNIEIHPVPKIKDNKMTSASYWAAGVSSKSNFKKEASLFLKFLTDKETQQKLYSIESRTRAFGEPYARKDLADQLKNSPIYSFVSQGNDAVSTFFASDTYDDGINSQSNAYLGNAVRSMLSSNSSSETSVSTLAQGVSQVLKQYGQ